MGVNVYAKNIGAKSFDRNWWWWRPLWEYTQHIGGDLVAHVDGGTNSGYGLDANKSCDLADLLDASLKDGTFSAWVIKRNDRLANLPQETCHVCKGTGNTVKYGDDEFTQCTICKGTAKVPAWETNYPSPDSDDIAEWVKFLRFSGGFSIC
jgi:hypothetical protein